MRFAYVILHYNAVQDTLECIDSIVSTNKNVDYGIIVVDNNSPDGSGKVLQERFQESRNIHVILNDTNLGFSKGNNIGYLYAKQLSADFIVMLNNDTLILQDDFAMRVEREYERNCFAVLGPRIETPDGNFCSNPLALSEASVSHYVLKTFLCCVNYIFIFFKSDFVYSMIKKPFKACAVNNKKGKSNLIGENIQDAMLHGCFWVFSPQYIRLFDGIIEATFLYGEEPLLYHRLLVNELNSIYVPSIHIFHKEDASTNDVCRSNREKKLFTGKYAILANMAIIKNRFTERPVNNKLDNCPCNSLYENKK